MSNDHLVADRPGLRPMNNETASAVPRRSRRIFGQVRTDVLMMVVCGLVAWLVSIAFELSESFINFSRSHEHWELDEIIIGMFIFCVVGTVYLFFRTRDLRLEVDARTRMQNDLYWAAHHDALTRLPNRRFLESFIAQEDRRHGGEVRQSFCVFAVDLDGFKKVNDLHGHAIGDCLLVAVADRLRDVVPDALVARVGGDEFVIVASLKRLRNAPTVAAQIVAEMCRPFDFGIIHAQIGCGVGTDISGRDRGSLAQAVQNADIALSEAKRTGRNRVLSFVPAMGERLNRRNALETELRAAIVADAIWPQFQPLFDLKTRKLHGFELLARWRRASGKEVAAQQMLEIAAELGIIVQLSENMLRRGCTAAQGWGDDLILSFNIAPAELSDKLLAKRILGIVSETGFDPRRLVIEIAETAMEANAAHAAATLDELREAGVKIVLDDFGAGFSSLPELATLQLDGIKIDRSLFANLSDASANEKLVQAVIAFGHGLGIPITADDIETEDQLTWMSDLGCDFGQGFLLSQPLTADAVGEFLAQRG